MFNEITKKAVQEALKHPGDDRHEDGRRAAGAPRARSAGRLQDQPDALGQGPPRAERRPRAVGRAEAHLRSRARDRGVRPRGVLAPLRAARRPQSRPSSKRKLLKKGDDDHQGRQRGAVEGRPRATSKRATWIVSSVATKERKRNAAPPFITSKLQQAARFPVKKTMMIAQQLYEGVELPDWHRRRRRPHHLHAHRLGARGGRGADRGARVHRRRRSATTTCPRSRTSTRPSRMRRTRTRRSGRRRWSTTRKRSGRT